MSNSEISDCLQRAQLPDIKAVQASHLYGRVFFFMHGRGMMLCFMEVSDIRASGGGMGALERYIRSCDLLQRNMAPTF